MVGEKVSNNENRLESSSKANKRLTNAFYSSSIPTSTPKLNIEVKIEYNVGRTKLIDEHGTGRGNVKENLWLYGPDKLENYEYNRDLKYIYIKQRRHNTYFRFSIHGGFSEFAQNENCP